MELCLPFVSNSPFMLDRNRQCLVDSLKSLIWFELTKSSYRSICLFCNKKNFIKVHRNYEMGEGV